MLPLVSGHNADMPPQGCQSADLWLGAPPPDWREAVERAVREDMGSGDLSSAAFTTERIRWYIETQVPGTVCGLALAAHLLRSDECPVECPVRDGDRLESGVVVLRGEGPAGLILGRERPALNFLMHLSGIATETARYVQAVAGTGARIVDTRKTIPGERLLAKYAVRCGGGVNHRLGLFDGAMIKDNHIAAFGGIAPAVAALRRAIPHTVKIEVECETSAQADEAISAGAEILLLDNMEPTMMREIVARHRGKAIFEASGGITLATVRAAAESGVNLVSVGAITHSSPSLSLHLEVEGNGG